MPSVVWEMATHPKMP